MNVRFIMSKQLGKLSSWALKKINRNATSFPGKLSLTIDPDFFKSVTQNMKVVLITGTNGKTLTSSLITHILQEKYKVLNNSSGSNMVQGIATTFLSSDKEEIAVLEVDEANLKKLTPVLQPELIVFTNVFADQTDRFPTTLATYEYMTEGASLSPNSTVILNGDIPLFNHDKMVNEKVYFGFDIHNKSKLINTESTEDTRCPNCHNQLNYYSFSYENLGDYSCDNCGLTRPYLTHAVTAITNQTSNSSSFVIDNYTFKIEVGGLYNIYNALAAYSVGKHFNLSNQQIQSGFNKMPMKFGRQESFTLNEKEVVINLVKNTVGFNQIVDVIALDERPKSLICLFNNNYADGTDSSWIKDADFEKLLSLNVSEVHISGLIQSLIKERLSFESNLPIRTYSTIEEIITTIPSLNNDTVYVLATYTALLNFRDLLSKAGHVSNEMN